MTEYSDTNFNRPAIATVVRLLPTTAGIPFRMFVMLILCLFRIGVAGEESPRSITVPLGIIHNRIFVDVNFERANGTLRKARFWVDNGNPEFTISNSLGKDLGLDLSKVTKNEDGRTVASVHLPKMTIGGMPVDTAEADPKVLLESSDSFPEKDVEGNLPSTILQRYEMILDYPARRLTLAEPGLIKGGGTAVHCDIQPTTGMISIRTEVAGKRLDVSVDAGSAFTLFSSTIVSGWATEHPEWPQLEGAIGDANMFGAPYEATSLMMRLPSLTLGSSQVRHAPVVSMPDDFFDWYSRKTAVPVKGAIGGNILKLFRVFIDYPNRVVYLSRKTRLQQNEFDLVGVVLAPSRDRDGRFAIRGIAKKNGASLAEGIDTGDKLLRVDGSDIQGKTLGAAIDSLRGKPGAHHSLIVSRKGKEVAVKVRIERLL